MEYCFQDLGRNRSLETLRVVVSIAWRGQKLQKRRSKMELEKGNLKQQLCIVSLMSLQLKRVENWKGRRQGWPFMRNQRYWWIEVWGKSTWQDWRARGWMINYMRSKNGNLMVERSKTAVFCEDKLEWPFWCVRKCQMMSSCTVIHGHVTVTWSILFIGSPRPKLTYLLLKI